jgi:hypothetical protein
MKEMKRAKKWKKRTALASAIFISCICAYAQPMRELPPAGYPRDQNQTVSGNNAPPPPSVPVIPENPPEQEPLRLPLKPLPEPITRKPAASVTDDAAIAFSRTVAASVGQRVEIPFSGNGWVYLGESDSQIGIAYDSRRLDAEGQNFIFSAEKAGTYTLKFYKQDFIRDYTFYDKVRVIVTAAPETKSGGLTAVNRGTVFAEPRWPTAEQEAALIAGRAAQTDVLADPLANTTTQVNPQTAVDPAEANAKTDNIVNNTAQTGDANAVADAEKPEQFIQRAKTEFDAGNIPGALSILEQFWEKYPMGDDEAIWLYAQAYEANGPAKDIKTARSYYQRIINEFPLSPRREAAQKRIGYIDRYYLNIQ